MRKYNFKINEHFYSVNILSVDNDIATVDVNGILYEVEVQEELKPVKIVVPRKDFVLSADIFPSAKTYQAENSTGILRSPLPGKVIDILVKVGDRVIVGQKLICIEAMKMENNIRTDYSGTVKAIHFQTNDIVAAGEVLIEVE